jgi:microcystin-dependent protein
LAGSLSGDIGSTSLSTSQMPAHTHRFGKATNNSQSPQVGTAQRTSGQVTQNVNSLATSSVGGGGSHNHTTGNLAVSMSGTPTISSATATINVQYVDFIIANKD